MLYDFKEIKGTKLEDDFHSLSDFLDELGFPPIQTTGFKLIKADLSKEDKKGNIKFRPDGIYLESNNHEYKGYIYIKYPDIVQYGFPKFHILECKTIMEQKMKGNFVDRYFWHNSPTVTLEDKKTAKIYDNITLNLCFNCKTKGAPDTTQEFYDDLDVTSDAADIDDIEVDIFGYVRDWQQRSTNYKKKKNYTCECCSIQMDGIDKRYIQTDHIDGNKTNNPEDGSNFQCLCILCHSYKDDLHIKNFSKRRNKKVLDTFVSKFRQQLQECGNKYLNQYFKDNSQVN